MHSNFRGRPFTSRRELAESNAVRAAVIVFSIGEEAFWRFLLWGVVEDAAALMVLLSDSQILLQSLL